MAHISTDRKMCCIYIKFYKMIKGGGGLSLTPCGKAREVANAERVLLFTNAVISYMSTSIQKYTYEMHYLR